MLGTNDRVDDAKESIAPDQSKRHARIYPNNPLAEFNIGAEPSRNKMVTVEINVSEIEKNLPEHLKKKFEENNAQQSSNGLPQENKTSFSLKDLYDHALKLNREISSYIKKNSLPKDELAQLKSTQKATTQLLLTLPRVRQGLLTLAGEQAEDLINNIRTLQRTNTTLPSLKLAVLQSIQPKVENAFKEILGPVMPPMGSPRPNVRHNVVAKSGIGENWGKEEEPVIYLSKPQIKRR